MHKRRPTPQLTLPLIPPIGSPWGIEAEYAPFDVDLWRQIV
jgi:hypothetical protein